MPSQTRKSASGNILDSVYKCRLHASIAGNDLLTVGTSVDDILASIHTERNETASKVASNQTKDDTDEPGKCASFIVCGRHNVCSAVWALGTHWGLMECLHNSKSWLVNHDSTGCGVATRGIGLLWVSLLWVALLCVGLLWVAMLWVALWWVAMRWLPCWRLAIAIAWLAIACL